MIINDGSGGNFAAKVDSNKRVHTQSVVETEAQHAVETGEAYNINTGIITINGDSSLLYIRNNETRDVIVESTIFALGVGDTSDLPEVDIVRNPTAGDLITDATPVAINSNRNYGSSKTLDADAFKGKDGGVMTDGDDSLLFMVSAAGRVPATVTLLLKKGSSLGIRIRPFLTSGSMKVYCAAVVHIKDDSSRD